ncbi:MAG: response regulator [Proteobacteria bacterium]|nr:response regulator [Pseudomonadota bacterium]
MKVLMADDEAAMRDRLAELMAGVENAQLRFVEQDAVVAMLNAAAWRPAVVILDVFMRGAATLRVLEEMKKEWPGMAVVISAWVDQPYGHVYLNCGADGFLDKSGGWEALGALVLERAARAAAPRVDGRRSAITMG